MIRPEFAAGLMELERAYQDLDGDGVPDGMKFDQAQINTEGMTPDYGNRVYEATRDPTFLERMGQNVADVALPYIMPMLADEDSATVKTLQGDIPGAIAKNVGDAASVFTPEGLEAGAAGAVSPFKSFLPPQMAVDVDMSMEKNPTAATIGSFAAAGPIVKGAGMAARGFQAMSRPMQLATATGAGVLAGTDVARTQTADDGLIPIAELRNMAPDQVRAVQERLQAAGLYDGSLDGRAYLNSGREGNTVRAARRYNSNIRRAQSAREVANGPEAQARAARLKMEAEQRSKDAELRREQEAQRAETERLRLERNQRIANVREARVRNAESGGVSDYIPYAAFGAGALAGAGAQGLKYWIKSREPYKIARQMRGPAAESRALSMTKDGKPRVAGAGNQSKKSADAEMAKRYGTGKSLFDITGTKYRADGANDAKLFAPRGDLKGDTAFYGLMGASLAGQEYYKGMQLDEYRQNMEKFHETGDDGYLKRADQNMKTIQIIDNTMKGEIGLLAGSALGKVLPKVPRTPVDPRPRLRDKFLRPNAYKADEAAFNSSQATKDLATLRGEIEAGRKYFAGRELPGDRQPTSVLDRLLGRGRNAQRALPAPAGPGPVRSGSTGSAPTGANKASTGSNQGGQKSKASASPNRSSNRAGSGENDRIFLRNAIADRRNSGEKISASELTKMLNTDRKLRGQPRVKTEQVQKKLDTMARYEKQTGRKLTDAEIRNLPDKGGMPNKFGRASLPAVAGVGFAGNAFMSDPAAAVPIPGVSVVYDERVGRLRAPNGQFARGE